MKILVLNAGSSSLKYKLFEMENETVIYSGMIEQIKEGGYSDALKSVQDELKSVGIQTLDMLDGIGHRVVHGGEEFQSSVVIDDYVEDVIQSLIPLAPLHNGPNLQGIKEARKSAPHVKQIAVFDTAFHQTLPQKAYMYALPYELYEKEGIRRYGFHGTSHSYVSKQAAKILNKEIQNLNLISLHLGNGASVCAIQGGKSIDTSMGFTPLEGLIMGTRCGDVDSAILFYLHRVLGYTIDEIDTLLNKNSGLKGICDQNDMRCVHSLIDSQDEKAKLAFEMFCYRAKKYVGAYAAILGRVDALIFTGGIGENDAKTREAIAEMLPFKCEVFVIQTDEEKEIALQVQSLIGK